MKNKIYIFAIVALMMLTALTAACNKQSVQPVTEAATSAPTESPTQPDTEQPTEEPTESPTETPTEAIAPTVDPNAEDKDELTNGEWTLSKVYAGGNEFLPNEFYGSSIRLGDSIEFYEDDTFHCVLGLKGCKGTYSIENGDVTLHLTAKYDGKSTDGNPCDEYTPLIWDKEANTIQFKLNNVDNLFTKN